jgi:GNAT superfamily N-acetyltransferase
MIFADAQLARRLEAAEAANARGCSARDGAAVLEIAGGIAIFMGVESPLSQAVGVGLNGPVSRAEIGQMESFFRSRGARVSIDLCPLADPGLLPVLADRGYRPTEFNNVLVKSLAGAPIAMTPRVRRAAAEEQESWSHTVGWGFFDRPELTSAEMDIGRSVFAMPGALCYLAVTDSCDPVGGAAAAIRDGLATLFADSTIPGFRRCGLHRELIGARLNEAIAQGCDAATAATLPGSASQRNYERMGFEVVYTKITLVA